MTRFSLGLFIVLALVLAVPFSSNSAQAGPQDMVPGEYIIVLKETNQNASEAIATVRGRHAVSPDRLFNKAIRGFSARLSDNQVSALEADQSVAYVVPDRIVSASRGIDSSRQPAYPAAKPTSPSSPSPSPVPAQVTPKGVARIGLSANKGTGIGVAVLDTGIDLTHPDLASNIIANTSCVNGKKTGNDDDGHGSHIAGTIAALDNNIGVRGVAPEAKLIAVKVLASSGYGTWSSVICGIDWVTANAATYNIRVANLSLGGAGSSDNNCGKTNNDPLHTAICRSTAAGVTYVVAAGNESVNASTEVPSAYDDTVITVSALTDSDGQAGGLGPLTGHGYDDTFPSFSNFGAAVDLGAPGVSIYSTFKGGVYATITGTSMASPHVAGAAALYLKNNPSSSWNEVRDGLKAIAEPLGSGHTDPSGKHSELVVQAASL